MAQQDRSTIKTFFETGDIPTEAQFGDSFDSQVFWVDDVETDLTSNSDDKVPTVKAVVDGIAAIPNELTTDELAAINGANSPDATNVFLTEDDEVYTKDANDNIFYKGVTPTLGTSCSKNIFHKTGGAITLGNAAIGNIFEPTENTTNFVFGANLRNVTIKAGNYPSSPSAGTLNLTAGGYAFLYNKDYPSEIFVGANGAALHSYYDSANDRYVVTNLVTLGFIYIGGGGDVYLANDQTFTGENTFAIASGSKEPIIVTKGGNGAGIKVTKSSGSGDAIEVAQGSLSIADETASRIASFDGSKRVKSLDTTTYPSLTELAYVKGVTGAIQTQIDIARRATIFFTPAQINPVDSTTYYFSSALIISTTATAVDMNVGYAFKVIGAIIQAVNSGGTQGSSENSTLQLKNTTANTSTSIGTFKTDATTGNQTEVTYTGLNISVAATDSFALQWDFPAPNPNPTNVFMRVNLLIEFL